MSREEYHWKVNGTVHAVSHAPDRSLLSVLRNELGLTGTKYGCGEGACGACTVLLGDAPVNACQVRSSEVGDREVTTIEGLARNGTLNPVQRAFVELGAFQCGFCTAGIVVRATALLRSQPRPSRAEIRRALETNLCRCCGYSRILKAVERAAELARAPGGRA
jgi:aerobic-type carbon monoxide dehydrogenase small subunit (CoxS/CutS family)